jgi:hypothetical protein
MIAWKSYGVVEATIDAVAFDGVERETVKTFVWTSN